MTVYLGIDGGGTGCRAALCDSTGRILGRGMAGPANIASDPEGAATNIRAAAEAAAKAAGGVPLERCWAGLGLAGAKAAGAAERLHTRLPFAGALIVSDALTAAQGALGSGRDGIVAALGTGSVYARRQAGTFRQIGGRGLSIGDEAGGAWLGRNAMAMALRAHDGMEPESPLLRDLVARFGGADPAVGWTVRAKPADFAALAPEIARSSDPAARTLIRAGLAQIERALHVLDAGSGVAVVLIGGLAPVYAPLLAPRWPLRPAAGDALDGALSLARGEFVPLSP